VGHLPNEFLGGAGTITSKVRACESEKCLDSLGYPVEPQQIKLNTGQHWVGALSFQNLKTHLSHSQHSVQKLELNSM
jgi:hypothetical protein